MTGSHPFLSHSFTEKGQRKKIKIITTNFTQRPKLVDFFQTKFSNIILKYITDVRTAFQKLFQRRDFLMVFCLNG
jgi:hypothetical protein